MLLRQGLPGPQMTVLEAAVKQARPPALLFVQLGCACTAKQPQHGACASGRCID